MGGGWGLEMLQKWAGGRGTRWAPIRFTAEMERPGDAGEGVGVPSFTLGGINVLGNYVTAGAS